MTAMTRKEALAHALEAERLVMRIAMGCLEISLDELIVGSDVLDPLRRFISMLSGGEESAEVPVMEEKDNSDAPF